MHDDDALHAWFIFNLHTRTSFIFTRCTLIDICTVYRQLLSKPLARKIKNPDLLWGPAACSWWLIHSDPLSGNNCPTLWLLPLSPLSCPSVRITLFTMTTSTIGLLCPGQHSNYNFWNHSSSHIRSITKNSIIWLVYSQREKCCALTFCGFFEALKIFFPKVYLSP